MPGWGTAVTGSANAGPLEIAGRLDNTGAVLTLGSASGFDSLSFPDTGPRTEADRGQARILGGTVINLGVPIQWGSGLLDGVSWQGPLALADHERLGLAHSIAAGGIVLGDGANLVIAGDTELSGAAVTLSGAAAAIVPDGPSASTLTLDSGVTAVLNGQQLEIDCADLVNGGRLQASGPGSSLTISGRALVNTGTIQASNGAALRIGSTGSQGDPDSSFSNTGAISVDAASSLVLAAALTTAQLDALGLAGGALTLAGTLDNQGSTLRLDTGGRYGKLTLRGTIVGGVVAAGTAPDFASATLQDVAWRGPLTLGGGGRFTIRDGLAVTGAGGAGPGLMNLTGADSAVLAELPADGAGRIRLDDLTIHIGAVGGMVTVSALRADPQQHGFLTLGAGATLLADSPGAGPMLLLGAIRNEGQIIANQGSVAVGLDGGLLPPDNPFDLAGPPAAEFVNTGTIRAASGNGSTFDFAAQGSLANSGTIIAAAGDHVLIHAAATNSGTLGVEAGGWVTATSLVGAGNLTLSGTTIARGLVELAGPASGQAIRFLDSFGTLRIAGGNAVSGVVTGFRPGDAIDAAGVSPADVTFSAGQLQLGASAVLTLADAGFSADQFRITDDGTGGTLVTTTHGADPASPYRYALTDTIAGRSFKADGQDYDGPVSYLQSQDIWASAHDVAIVSAVPNAFLHGGTGSDALRATAGSNVLDGGTGSSFLVGADGRDGGNDVFFADGRSGATVWSTLVGFHTGDLVTVWGFTAGLSTFSWAADEGAAGYTGATLHAELGGAGTGVTASLTFAGMQLGDTGAHLAMSTGSIGGNDYALFQFV